MAALIVIKVFFLKFSIADTQNAGFQQCKEVHSVWQDVREHAGPVDARAHPQPLPQVQVGESPSREPLAGFAGRRFLAPGCSRDTSGPTLGTNRLDVPTVESPLQIGDLPLLHRILLIAEHPGQIFGLTCKPILRSRTTSANAATSLLLSRAT